MRTILTLVTISGIVFIIICSFKKNDNKVNAVDIGVVVSDLQRSLNFYTSVLRMEQIGTWHSTKERSTTYDINNGKAFDIIDLKLDCDGYVLKYKLNNTPGNTVQDGVAPNEIENYTFEKLGTRYLTINVKSIDPFMERIKKNNIKFKLVTLPNGYRVVLLHDPDGALLEIASF